MPDLPLSLYIHLPWCVEKCPYCDFNSFKKQNHDSELIYTDALCLDLDNSAKMALNRPIQSVFFGGGTPSLFDCDHIERILERLRVNFTLAPACEITLEMNPSSFEIAKLERWLHMGINRVSIGAQSFDNLSLSAIGRTHNATQAVDAIQAALALPFRSVNVDIMYGLPGQTIAQAEHDLATVIALAPPHISWYELTIEANTYFAKHRPQIPDHEMQYTICQHGLAQLAEAGYQRYEISAYALSHQHECTHNKNYWHFGDYIGCGAGASSKVTSHGEILRYQKHRVPGLYQQAPTRQVQIHKVQNSEVVFEYMLNKLRLMQPFTIQDVADATLCDAMLIQQACRPALQSGWLEIHANQTIHLTPSGRLFMNDCQASFLNN